MEREKQRFFMICVTLVLVMLGGCESTKTDLLEPPERNATTVQFGKDLFALVTQKMHELCVIKLRENLQSCVETDIKFGFMEAGGSEDTWELLIQAAKYTEFENGSRYGDKLKADKILDVDVVEYIRSTLKNADNPKKLAFSAGFISVFENRDRALAHLDTIWIWALPSD